MIKCKNREVICNAKDYVESDNSYILIINTIEVVVILSMLGCINMDIEDKVCIQ